VCSLPPRLVLGSSLIPEVDQFPSDGRIVFDFLRCDYAQQEQTAHRCTSTVPSQPIADGTSGKAVVRFLGPTLVALYDVINFPVSVRMVSPAPVFKDEWVSAKVAMPLGLREDFS